MPNFDRCKFIFLCGLHRSGTSPLFRILREHPEISGFRDTGVPEDEGQHLQSVFPPAKSYGGPGQFGFAREAHLTESSGFVTSENREKLFAEWSRYWDLNKPYLLEKSPPNLIRTRFLQAIFPNSFFIIVIRHPIPVSLSTSKWAPLTMDSLMKHWLHCHRIFVRDRPYLRNVLLIRYEDLISSALALEQIAEFIGVAPHAYSALDPAGNDRYFTAWRNRAVAKEGREEYRRIVKKYERKVQSYSYSLVDFGPSAAFSAEGRPRIGPTRKFTKG